MSVGCKLTGGGGGVLQAVEYHGEVVGLRVLPSGRRHHLLPTPPCVHFCIKSWSLAGRY